MLKDRTTRGEKLIEELLKKLPKEDYIFFAESMIVPDEGSETNPDFIVISRQKGVIVIEVKDWVKLIRGNKEQIHIERRDGQTVPERNPYLIARGYALDLVDKLKKREELCQRYKGKIILKFPWMASVALPNIPQKVVRQLEDGRIWTKGTIFPREYLSDPQTFQNALMNIPTPQGTQLRASIDEITIDAIRGVIDPQIIVVNEQGEDLGTLTAAQEALMKEPVPALQAQQMPLFDTEKLSNEATNVATSIHTRLVRGVAGSGKTLILKYRARYLLDQYPEIKMLVTSFNKDLASDLKRHIPDVEVTNFHKVCTKILGKQWRSPQKAEKWLEDYAAAEMSQVGLDVEYIADEFGWRKEMELYDTDAYLEIERRGRGQALSMEKRQIINTLFQKYISFQESHGEIDWADVPAMTLKALENEHHMAHQYDAILIDEAQDFAPLWIQVIKKLLKPNGYLFACDDPTQSLFNYYSWKEKGLDVVGRTRSLKVPFRCSRQISYAAYSLIASDPLLVKNEEITRPNLNSREILDGEKPLVINCTNSPQEVKVIENEILSLLSQGVPSEQIAVLCHSRYHLKNWTSVEQKGVYVGSFKQMKGLEFTAVFVPSLHSAFINDNTDESISKTRRKIFTAMTRARHTLVLSYQNELPKPLEPILKYVTHENAG